MRIKPWLGFLVLLPCAHAHAHPRAPSTHLAAVGADRSPHPSLVNSLFGRKPPEKSLVLVPEGAQLARLADLRGGAQAQTKALVVAVKEGMSALRAHTLARELDLSNEARTEVYYEGTKAEQEEATRIDRGTAPVRLKSNALAWMVRTQQGHGALLHDLQDDRPFATVRAGQHTGEHGGDFHVVNTLAALDHVAAIDAAAASMGSWRRHPFDGFPMLLTLMGPDEHFRVSEYVGSTLFPPGTMVPFRFGGIAYPTKVSALVGNALDQHPYNVAELSPGSNRFSDHFPLLRFVGHELHKAIAPAHYFGENGPGRPVVDDTIGVPDVVGF